MSYDPEVMRMSNEIVLQRMRQAQAQAAQPVAKAQAEQFLEPNSEKAQVFLGMLDRAHEEARAASRYSHARVVPVLVLRDGRQLPIWRSEIAGDHLLVEVATEFADFGSEPKITSERIHLDEVRSVYGLDITDDVPPTVEVRPKAIAKAEQPAIVVNVQAPPPVVIPPAAVTVTLTRPAERKVTVRGEDGKTYTADISTKEGPPKES